MRVLHIIESFDGQATETWLYQLLRHFNDVGVKVDWTFYSTLGRAGKADDAVRKLGGEIIYSPVPIGEKRRFVESLRKVVIEGKYDIIHSHHDIMSAVYLLAVAGLHLKKRVVHVHNTSLSLPTPNQVKRAIVYWPMRWICSYAADNIVGVSEEALKSMACSLKPREGRDRVIHCGIDMAPYHRDPPDRVKFLRSLGLREDSKILLFAGKLSDYKNPLFILDILQVLTSRDPAFCALFAGSGPLEGEVIEKAKQKSLSSKVRSLGWREDLPSVMRSCDVLVCPTLESPREGLGLVTVEAQAAGLPVVMSLSVPGEAVVSPELVVALPLAAGPSAWADAVLRISKVEASIKATALSKVEASSFSVPESAARIFALYEA